MQVPTITNLTRLHPKYNNSDHSLECIQDVLELRTANWVARREEAGPKTIEQIHKVRWPVEDSIAPILTCFEPQDAAMDAMKKSLEAADTGPPPR